MNLTHHEVPPMYNEKFRSSIEVHSN